MPLLLELFCGTKSVGKVASENGYEVISVDINPKCNPDVCIDIMRFDFKQYVPFTFDIIWASPPCNTFSNFNNCRYSPDEILHRQNTMGVPMLKKTLEIIDYLKPRLYFIENPRGMMQNYIDENIHPKYQADYCQYGCHYQKPTHFWTNRVGLKLKTCPGIYCGNRDSKNRRRHITNVSYIPLSRRYYIPPDLIQELCFMKHNL